MRIDIDVPDGQSGLWCVETFEVSQKDADFENMRAAFACSARPIKPGTYKRLMRGHTVVMSNTPEEIRDHYYFISHAKRVGGNVLINGLGLGVCLKAILESDAVDFVTVVEKEQDVINLVAPTYLLSNPGRVSIICGDALTWRPVRGTKYSCVWHDIWDNICADNLPDMKKLHRSYGRRCDWQGSWARELIR